jgi:hypothetical protein
MSWMMFFVPYSRMKMNGPYGLSFFLTPHVIFPPNLHILHVWDRNTGLVQLKPLLTDRKEVKLKILGIHHDLKVEIPQHWSDNILYHKERREASSAGYTTISRTIPRTIRQIKVQMPEIDPLRLHQSVEILSAFTLSHLQRASMLSQSSQISA